MFLMWVLGVVVLGGFYLAFRWSGEEVRKPWGDAPPDSDVRVVERYLWYLAVAVGAGAASGVVMMGAGGRLAMRLLGAAAGDSAQGRLTEAGEIVGEVTVDGSLGFIIFVGLLGGLASGAAFMLIQRWLPGGRLKGATYGALLFVIGSTRFDPLRPENLDFDIVGPGWYAILLFAAIAIGHGMLLAAIAGRYSRSLPVISKRMRTIARYAPLLLLVPAFPVLVLVLGGLVIGILARRLPLVMLPVLHPRSLLGGRAIGVLAALVLLPGFVTALADIAGRP